MTTIPAKPSHSGILIYQTDDGKIRIEVRLENETVWLSQKLMAGLFQVSVPTVNEHIRNLYDEGELQPAATIRKFRIVQTEGSRQVSRNVDFYDKAIKKASTEYEKYRSLHINNPSPVERHFLEAVKEIKRLEKKSKSRATRKT